MRTPGIKTLTAAGCLGIALTTVTVVAPGTAQAANAITDAEVRQNRLDCAHPPGYRGVVDATLARDTAVRGREDAAAAAAAASAARDRASAALAAAHAAATEATNARAAAQDTFDTAAATSKSAQHAANARSKDVNAAAKALSKADRAATAAAKARAATKAATAKATKRVEALERAVKAAIAKKQPAKVKALRAKLVPARHAAGNARTKLAAATKRAAHAAETRAAAQAATVTAAQALTDAQTALTSAQQAEAVAAQALAAAVSNEATANTALADANTALATAAGANDAAQARLREAQAFLDRTQAALGDARTAYRNLPVVFVTQNLNFGTGARADTYTLDRMCALGADYMMVQEAKNISVAALIPDHLRTNQNTADEARAGSALVWRRANDLDPAGRVGPIAGLGLRLVCDARAARVEMLNRFASWADTVVDGKKTRVITVHYAPSRYSQTWAETNAAVRKIIAERPGGEWVVGGDFNQSPDAVARALGGSGLGSGVDGFVISGGLVATNVSVDNWSKNHGLTDHPTVRMALKAK